MVKTDILEKIIQLTGSWSLTSIAQIIHLIQNPFYFLHRITIKNKVIKILATANYLMILRNPYLIISMLKMIM